MIRFHNVSKRYEGGTEALSGVSFRIPEGEMVFVTGPSGAGKSTLLRLILALEPCSAGELVVGGVNLARLPRSRVPAHRQRIGAVFQDHQLLFDRSVADNVALPLQIAGLSPRESRRRIRAALDKVGLLGKERLMPHRLSGGEQQRVGIARAVVNRPDIILADEPTGNLDPALSADIMAVFRQFKQVGVSLLVASHDLALIGSLGCRILTLERGRLAGDR